MGQLIVALLFCSAALAQGFPSKPVRIIVPLVPGGNQDIVARAVAEELAKGLGQQVIVENRPGASAIVGTQFVKGAPPDGYTLLSVAVTFARVPGVVKAANYDPRTDFAGVSLVCRIPQVLVVNPGLRGEERAGAGRDGEGEAGRDHLRRLGQRLDRPCRRRAVHARRPAPSCCR